MEKNQRQEKFFKKKNYHRFHKRNNNHHLDSINWEQQENANPNRMVNHPFDRLIPQLQRTSLHQNNDKSTATEIKIQDNNIQQESKEEIHTNYLKRRNSKLSKNNSGELKCQHSIPPIKRLDWASQVEAASRSDAEEDQLPDLTEWHMEPDWHPTQLPTIPPSIPPLKMQDESPLQLRSRRSSLEIQSRPEILHFRLKNRPIHVQLGSTNSSSISNKFKLSTQEDLPIKGDTLLLPSKNSSVDETPPLSTKVIRSSTLLDSIPRPVTSTTISSPNISPLIEQHKQRIASPPHTPLSPPSTSTSTSTTHTAPRSTSSSIELVPSSSSSNSSFAPRDDPSFGITPSGEQAGWNTFININHRGIDFSTSPSFSNSTNLPTPKDHNCNCPPTHLPDLQITQPACLTLHYNEKEFSADLQDQQNKVENVARTNKGDKREEKVDWTVDDSSINPLVAKVRKETDTGQHCDVSDPRCDTRSMNGAEIQSQKDSAQLFSGSTASDEKKEIHSNEECDERNEDLTMFRQSTVNNQVVQEHQEIGDEEIKSNLKKSHRKKKNRRNKITHTQEKQVNEFSDTHQDDQVTLSTSSNVDSIKPTQPVPSNPSSKVFKETGKSRKTNESNKASVHLFDKLTGGALLHPPHHSENCFQND